jgi:hypothetical protein
MPRWFKVRPKTSCTVVWALAAQTDTNAFTTSKRNTGFMREHTTKVLKRPFRSKQDNPCKPHLLAEEAEGYLHMATLLTLRPPAFMPSNSTRMPAAWWFWHASKYAIRDKRHCGRRCRLRHEYYYTNESAGDSNESLPQYKQAIRTLQRSPVRV